MTLSVSVTKFRVVVVLAALSLGLVLSAIIMGVIFSGSARSIDDYVARFVALDDEVQERWGPLYYHSDPMKRERAKVATDFSRALANARAPRELEAPHKELLSALGQFAELDDQLSRRAKEAKSSEELTQIYRSTLGGPEWSAAAARFRNACLQIRDAAHRHGFSIEFGCGESNGTSQTSISICIPQAPDLPAEQPTPTGTCDAQNEGCSPNTNTFVDSSSSGRPDLPEGMVAASGFKSFTDDAGLQATVCAILYGTYEADDSLAFYSFQNGVWNRLAGAQLRHRGNLAEVTLAALPDNLQVLKPLKDLEAIAR